MRYIFFNMKDNNYKLGLLRYVYPGIAVFLLVVFFYSMSIGIVSTNDGSHFALVNSLVKYGDSKLRDNYRFALHDSAIYKGECFADRNPGLAFTLYSFHAIFKPIEKFLMPVKTDEFSEGKLDDTENRLLALLLFVPALLGALFPFLVYYALRQMNYDPLISGIVSVFFLFGTLMIRYSTLLYSHVPAVILVTIAYFLLFEFKKRRKIICLSAACFSLSCAVLCEHIIIVLYLPIAVYMLAAGKEFLKPRILLAGVISAVLPMIPLLVYDYVNFENPFVIAHMHHSSLKFHESLSTTFNFSNVPTHMKLLLVSYSIAEYPFISLFQSSSFLIFMILLPLLLILQKRVLRPELWICLIGFAISVTAVCSYDIPIGGYDLDYRHMLFAIPLLCPLFAETLLQAKGFFEQKGVRYGFPAFLMVLSIFASCSFITQLEHVRIYLFQEKNSALFYNFLPGLVNCSIIFTALAILIILAAASFALIKRFTGTTVSGNEKY